MSDPARGKVWLVGAGPGDPELLTVRAVRVLGDADVILADDLVDPRVLAHVGAGARVLHVGKRGGRPSTDQRFFDRVMVGAARRGQRVVRLKGGDPFVFGRGGEECEALRAAGIDVEVVAGITAGIAAPAAIGVPVTDRRHGPGVVFVTGQNGAGEGSFRTLPGAGACSPIQPVRRSTAIERRVRTNCGKQARQRFDWV